MTKCLCEFYARFVISVNRLKTMGAKGKEAW